MLILLSIIFPIVCGILLYFRNRNKEPGGHAVYAAGILITDALALAAAFSGQRLSLFTLSPKVNFAFAFDSVGRWFLVAVLLLYTLTLFYAFMYLRIEEREATFLAFYFVSLGALISVCASDNLVTAYLGFELTTLSTVPLVLHEQTKDAVAAGLKYLFYSIGGALLGLLGVFVVYHFAGESVAFVPGGILDAVRVAGHEGTLRVACFLAILGYGTKAGMYPMHGWLPTAHPIAPAPASALLSGIIAKSGVLVIIRFVFYSVGPELIRGTWVQYAWIGIALVTVFMGSMMAFQEKVLKKRLAYSTISQISYVMVGLALLTQDGLNGSLLQVMQHAASKACLFLCAGAFIYLYNKRRVEELAGIGKTMPVVLWCFTFAAMSLVGIPPMGGFTSKWHLALASLHADVGFLSILAPVVLLISALLTAGYLFPIMINGFFPPGEHAGHGHGADHEEHGEAGEQERVQEETPHMMWIPLIGLCLITLFVGLFGNSLLGLFGGIV